MSRSFNSDDLRRIVELGGQALEAEDRFICGCLHRNPAYRESSQVAGIVYLKDEGYYQRLIVRALLPSFPYIVKPEYAQGGRKFDIALFSAVNEDPVALGELKLWMDSAFGAVPGIAADIGKLARGSWGQFVLVFTSAKKGDLDGCIEKMLTMLKCSGNKACLYKFDSEFNNDGHGNIEHDAEFALIGILLKESVA